MNIRKSLNSLKKQAIVLTSVLVVVSTPTLISFADVSTTPVITVGQSTLLGYNSNIDGIEDLTNDVRTNDVIISGYIEDEIITSETTNINDMTANNEVIETVLDVSENRESKSGNRVYLGRFKVTHYCPCSKCNGKFKGTASGRAMKVGTTIAVDPKVIPLGSYVEIGGHTYRADDTGSAIKKNRIDILASTHAEALRLGTYTTDVYIVR